MFRLGVFFPKAENLEGRVHNSLHRGMEVRGNPRAKGDNDQDVKETF